LFFIEPSPKYIHEDRSPEEPMPGDLDLDDPSSLPPTERPPDLPTPMAMKPSKRPKPNNYHDDPSKFLFCLILVLQHSFPACCLWTRILSWPTTSYRFLYNFNFLEILNFLYRFWLFLSQIWWFADIKSTIASPRCQLFRNNDVFSTYDATDQQMKYVWTYYKSCKFHSRSFDALRAAGWEPQKQPPPVP